MSAYTNLYAWIYAAVDMCSCEYVQQWLCAAEKLRVALEPWNCAELIFDYVQSFAV